MKRTRDDYEPAFLDIHGVARRYGVKRATIWSWMEKGRFPQPHRFTPGCSRWALVDLAEWEGEKRAQRTSRHQWEGDERRRQQRGRDKAVQ